MQVETVPWPIGTVRYPVGDGSYVYHIPSDRVDITTGGGGLSPDSLPDTYFTYPGGLVHVPAPNIVVDE